eukprot:scaffold5504_cov267-Pinguiococcus_pyrenoidosus.AAC.1
MPRLAGLGFKCWVLCRRAKIPQLPHSCHSTDSAALVRTYYETLWPAGVVLSGNAFYIPRSVCREYPMALRFLRDPLLEDKDIALRAVKINVACAFHLALA